MSDTPRTDTAVSWGFPEHVKADFARQLERELAALHERLAQAKRLYEMTLASEIDWMRKHERAEAQLAALKRHAEALCDRLCADHPVDHTIGAALPSEVYAYRAAFPKEA